MQKKEEKVITLTMTMSEYHSLFDCLYVIQGTELTPPQSGYLVEGDIEFAKAFMNLETV